MSAVYRICEKVGWQMSRSAPGQPDRIQIKDIPTMLVKCQYCGEDVQLGVLPFHEKLCQDSRGSSTTTTTTGGGRRP
jgi:hypothetical protein